VGEHASASEGTQGYRDGTVNRPDGYGGRGWEQDDGWGETTVVAREKRFE